MLPPYNSTAINNIQNATFNTFASACDKVKLVTILLYAQSRYRKKKCIMRIEVPLIDNKAYYEVQRSCERVCLYPFVYAGS